MLECGQERNSRMWAGEKCWNVGRKNDRMWAGEKC